MALYLVERYLPADDADQLTTMAARVARLARDTEHDVSYHWCLVTHEDATAFCLFEASEITAVTDLNRRAGFPLDRVTPVTVVHLGSGAAAPPGRR